MSSGTKSRQWIGIDFSGDARKWSPKCGRSNVWVATLISVGKERYKLATLDPVQHLAGDGVPFSRLVQLLQNGGFEAAAIDAPFSIPARYLPGTHRHLLQLVDSVPCSERPFPESRAFLNAISSRNVPPELKPYRETENFWRHKGVNVRSTLWNGARPGAPMTAACLKLLARTQSPMWPWSTGTGLLVEAFPAAQLYVWGFGTRSYSRDVEARREIVNCLRPMVELEGRSEILHSSPDALDAALCAFAAIAVTTGRLAHQPDGPLEEDFIAVHTPFGSS